MEYTLDFIQTVNDWQAYGMRERKNEIAQKLRSFSIDDHLKKCDKPCYRITDFRNHVKERSIFDAFLNQRILFGVTSWTTDYKVAQNFYKEGIPLYPYEGINYIIKITNCSNIILNIESLYSDTAFIKACEKHKKNIKEYSKGIGRFGNTQKEVILDIESVSVDNIYAFWGTSSTKEDFYKKYINDFVKIINLSNGKITYKFIDDFLNQNIGPHWDDDEQNVKCIISTLKKEVDFYNRLKQCGLLSFDNCFLTLDLDKTYA